MTPSRYSLFEARTTYDVLSAVFFHSSWRRFLWLVVQSVPNKSASVQERQHFPFILVRLIKSVCVCIVSLLEMQSGFLSRRTIHIDSTIELLLQGKRSLECYGFLKSGRRLNIKCNQRNLMDLDRSLLKRHQHNGIIPHSNAWQYAARPIFDAFKPLSGEFYPMRLLSRFCFFRLTLVSEKSWWCCSPWLGDRDVVIVS